MTIDLTQLQHTLYIGRPVPNWQFSNKNLIRTGLNRIKKLLMLLQITMWCLMTYLFIWNFTHLYCICRRESLELIELLHWIVKGLTYINIWWRLRFDLNFQAKILSEYHWPDPLICQIPFPVLWFQIQFSQNGHIQACIWYHFNPVKSQ